MTDSVERRPIITAADPTPSPTVTKAASPHEEMFDRAAKAVKDHFLKKNAPDHYGGAFEATGLIGNAVDMNGISARLRHIIVRSGDGGANFSPREKLMELLKDMAVNAILGMISLTDSNFLGK